MQYESLIFDIDGTLWNSTGLVAEGYNIQLRSEGYEHLCVTAEDLQSLFGKTMKEIADIMLATVPEDKRYGLMERCMATEQEYLHKDPCHIGYPKVRETLEALKKKQHRLFLVSNSQQGYPEIVISKMGLQGLFEDHLCFGDTGLPKGETIKLLMQRHGIQSACYIGDTQTDYVATQVAGIPFVFCAYGFGSPAAWDAKIDAFEDLLNL